MSGYLSPAIVLPESASPEAVVGGFAKLSVGTDKFAYGLGAAAENRKLLVPQPLTAIQQMYWTTNNHNTPRTLNAHQGVIYSISGSAAVAAFAPGCWRVTTSGTSDPAATFNTPNNVVVGAEGLVYHSYADLYRLTTANAVHGMGFADAAFAEAARFIFNAAAGTITARCTTGASSTVQEVATGVFGSTMLGVLCVIEYKSSSVVFSVYQGATLVGTTTITTKISTSPMRAYFGSNRPGTGASETLLDLYEIGWGHRNGYVRHFGKEP